MARRTWVAITLAGIGIVLMYAAGFDGNPRLLLGTAVAAVYDLTIAYENFPVGRVPGLLSLFFGPGERVHVHGRRFVAAEIPAEARATWILARFREKDARLAEFRKTGKLG